VPDAIDAAFPAAIFEGFEPGQHGITVRTKEDNTDDEKAACGILS
jgi:hypothetical protein